MVKRSRQSRDLDSLEEAEVEASLDVDAEIGIWVLKTQEGG